MKRSISFYISTGKQNSRYTLRKHVIEISEVQGISFPNDYDHYIVNLADSEEIAVKKAEDYFEQLAPALIEQGYECHLFTDPESYRAPRIGKLSAQMTNQINMTESGLFPFGKLQGQPFSIAEDNYILYWAERAAENIVQHALAAACSGIALERGLYAKRDAKRAEIAEQNARSEYIGKVKDRIDLEDLQIVFVRDVFDDRYQQHVNIVTMRSGDNVIVYKGGLLLGKKGDTVSMKATIKSHEEFRGTKQTYLSRPIVKNRIQAAVISC